MTDFYTALNTVISKCGANILDTPALCKEELHNAGIEENTLEEQLFFLILDKNIFFEIKKITGNDKEIKNIYDLAVKVYLRLFANEGYSNNREIILIKHIQTIVDVLDDNKLMQIEYCRNKKEATITDFETALRKLIQDYDTSVLENPNRVSAFFNEISENVLKDESNEFKLFLEKMNKGNISFRNKKNKYFLKIVKQVLDSFGKNYVPLQKEYNRYEQEQEERKRIKENKKYPLEKNNKQKKTNTSVLGNGQTIAKIQKNKSLLQNSIDDFCDEDLFFDEYSFLWMVLVCPIFMVIYADIIFWEYLDGALYFCIYSSFFTIGICYGAFTYKFLTWKSTCIIKKKSNNDSIMDWIVFFIFDIIRITIGGIVGLIFWLLDSLDSLPIENNILWFIIPGMAYSGLFILLENIHIIYYKINKNPKLLQIITLAIINVIIIIGIVKFKSQNNFQSISHNNEKLSYIVIGKNEEIKTLKKAIKLIDEGGTIELRPGTYNGNININKNIKLLGIKEDIKTKSSSELPIIKGQCKIKANAEIEGVVFTKGFSEENCLLVKSDSRIKNIAILNSAHDGIVFTAKNATLENSIISNCENYGIRCRGNANPTIINSHINRTSQAGICIEDNANTTLTNCIITNNKAYGLVIKNTASGNFSNCIINNSGFSGIVIKSPVKSVFLNCDIFNNGGNGVKISNGPRLKMGATSKFENCKLYDNKNGILIYNKANPILQDCEIYSNKVYGIWIKNDINGIYPSCFIHDNTVQNIFSQKKYNTDIQSTIKSNNGNTTVISPKPQITTLQAEPGETFTVPKYVHIDLNVHEEKDLESRTLFTVSKDSIVYLSNKHKDGIIVKIKFDDNHIGWLNSTYLRDFKITSVQVGNYNSDKDTWVVIPGNKLNALNMNQLGIKFDVETKINNDKDTTYYVRVINPENKYFQGKNTPSGFTGWFAGPTKTGSFQAIIKDIPNNYYKNHLGTWRIEIWYHDPKNTNEQNFTCIASTEFILY